MSAYQTFATILCLILLTSSCSFDQDEAFRPVSDGLMVLVGDEIVSLDADEVPATQVTGVSDIAVDEDEAIWFARPSEQLLEQLDGSESFSSAPLNPHFFAIGPNHFLVVDTVSEEIGFFDKKDQALVHTIAVEMPGKVVCLLDKFYVVSEDTTVRVFLDQALTEIGSVSLPASIENIQAVQDGSIVLSLGGSPRRAARIAYLAEALIEAPFNRSNLSAETPCNWLDQRFPSDVRAVFGTEWTSSVVLCEDSIRSESFAFGAGASFIAVDFFSGTCFFVQNQKLTAYSLSSQEVLNTWDWDQGELGKGFVHFQTLD